MELIAMTWFKALCCLALLQVSCGQSAAKAKPSINYPAPVATSPKSVLKDTVADAATYFDPLTQKNSSPGTGHRRNTAASFFQLSEFVSAVPPVNPVKPPNGTLPVRTRQVPITVPPQVTDAVEVLTTPPTLLPVSTVPPTVTAAQTTTAPIVSQTTTAPRVTAKQLKSYAKNKSVDVEDEAMNVAPSSHQSHITYIIVMGDKGSTEKYSKYATTDANTYVVKPAKTYQPTQAPHYESTPYYERPQSKYGVPKAEPYREKEKYVPSHEPEYDLYRPKYNAYEEETVYEARKTDYAAHTEAPKKYYPEYVQEKKYRKTQHFPEYKPSYYQSEYEPEYRTSYYPNDNQRYEKRAGHYNPPTYDDMDKKGFGRALQKSYYNEYPSHNHRNARVLSSFPPIASTLDNFQYDVVWQKKYRKRRDTLPTSEVVKTYKKPEPKLVNRKDFELALHRSYNDLPFYSTKRTGKSYPFNEKFPPITSTLENLLYNVAWTPQYRKKRDTQTANSRPIDTSGVKFQSLPKLMAESVKAKQHERRDNPSYGNRPIHYDAEKKESYEGPYVMTQLFGPPYEIGYIRSPVPDKHIYQDYLQFMKSSMTKTEKRDEYPAQKSDYKTDAYASATHKVSKGTYGESYADSRYVSDYEAPTYSPPTNYKSPSYSGSEYPVKKEAYGKDSYMEAAKDPYPKDGDKDPYGPKKTYGAPVYEPKKDAYPAPLYKEKENYKAKDEYTAVGTYKLTTPAYEKENYKNSADYGTAKTNYEAKYPEPKYDNKPGYQEPYAETKYDKKDDYKQDYAEPAYQAKDQYKNSKSYEEPKAYEKPYEEPKSYEKPYEAPKAYEKPYESPKAYEKPYESPKAYEKPYEAPKAYEKPYEANKGYEKPSEAPKAYDKPYEAPKAYEKTYEAPKAYEKPYESPKTYEKPYEAPKAYEKPYEAPKAYEKPYEAPKAYEKPYEAPKAYEKPYEAPKAYEKPYESPKAYEKPYEAPKAYEKPYEAPKAYEKPYEAPKAYEDSKGYDKEYDAPKSYDKSYEDTKGYEKPYEAPKSYEKPYEAPKAYEKPYEADYKKEEVYQKPYEAPKTYDQPKYEKPAPTYEKDYEAPKSYEKPYEKPAYSESYSEKQSYDKPYESPKSYEKPYEASKTYNKESVYDTEKLYEASDAYDTPKSYGGSKDYEAPKAYGGDKHDSYDKPYQNSKTYEQSYDQPKGYDSGYDSPKTTYDEKPYTAEKYDTYDAPKYEEPKKEYDDYKHDGYSNTQYEEKKKYPVIIGRYQVTSSDAFLPTKVGTKEEYKGSTYKKEEEYVVYYLPYGQPLPVPIQKRSIQVDEDMEVGESRLRGASVFHGPLAVRSADKSDGLYEAVGGSKVENVTFEKIMVDEEELENLMHGQLNGEAVEVRSAEGLLLEKQELATTSISEVAETEAPVATTLSDLVTLATEQAEVTTTGKVEATELLSDDNPNAVPSVTEELIPEEVLPRQQTTPVVDEPEFAAAAETTINTESTKEETIEVTTNAVQNENSNIEPLTTEPARSLYGIAYTTSVVKQVEPVESVKVQAPVVIEKVMSGHRILTSPPLTSRLEKHWNGYTTWWTKPGLKDGESTIKLIRKRMPKPVA